MTTSDTLALAQAELAAAHVWASPFGKGDGPQDAVDVGLLAATIEAIVGGTSSVVTTTSATANRCANC